MGELDDGSDRNLLHQNQVVNHREHQHQVRLCLEPMQQGTGLAVLPADSRCRPSEIGMNRLDGKLALAAHPIEALGGRSIAFQRHDLSSARRSQRAEDPAIGADIQHARRLQILQHIAHPIQLLRALLRRIVRQRSRIVGPLGARMFRHRAACPLA